MSAPEEAMTEPIPRRDPARMVGESYRDCVARMSGELKAGRLDHDRLAGELSRFRHKLTNIQAMLPALGEHLPADLRGELAAHIYVLPQPPLTEADIRWAQQVAAEHGLTAGGSETGGNRE